jgi:pyruvate ferredoxin oxidoreductase gamma subunit
MATIGKPVPNTALLAAFLKVTGLFPVDSLAAALRDRFSGDTLERNLELIDSVAADVEPGKWAEAQHA